MILHGISVVFGLLAFQGTGFVQCEQIHEILTDEEFSKVFRTTRDNVPEYEVVPIMHDLYKRSSADLKMQFSAFGRNFDIYLNPSDGILAGENTPVWLATPESNEKVNYKKLQSNIVGSVAKSFVAPKSLASFVVDESSIDKPVFHGTFKDFNIVPLPARVQDVAKEEAKILKREIPRLSRTLTASDYHVIIKTEASPRDEIAVATVEKQVDKIVQHFNGTDDHRRNRFANDIIYPSILIVTDYSSTPRTQDESMFKDEIRYQLAFWNSVDLRYRDLESPKVRLRIAGIVIGQGRSAIPYIDKFLNGTDLSCSQALGMMPTYWYQQQSNPDFKPDAYNVVITLTDCNLYRLKPKRVYVKGIAYSSSLCWQKRFLAVGLVHDDMKFGGINTATHELGHILGAKHDSNTTASCDGKIGYIMASSKIETIKMHYWSPCSLDTIKHFLGRASHCAERPAEVHQPGTPIERIAPGDILTAQQQCEAQGYSYACPPRPKMCKRLRCSSRPVNGIVPKVVCRITSVGALDGTVCAPGAICIRGVCNKQIRSYNEQSDQSR